MCGGGGGGGGRACVRNNNVKLAKNTFVNKHSFYISSRKYLQI